MNIQQSTSVTQIIVRRISERLRVVKDGLHSSRVSKPKRKLGRESIDFGYDLDLARDEVVLRDLEAELYTLTDQFNTEQGLKGASLV